MSSVTALRDRLSDLGRRRSFQIAVSAALSLAILAVAAVYHLEASRLARAAEGIPRLLEEANLLAKDAVAIELSEKGTLSFEGRTYGGEVFVPRFQKLFNEAGRIEQVAEAASILLGASRPPWLPVAIAEQPWIVPVAAALALAIVQLASFGGLVMPLVVVIATASAAAGGLALAGLGWLVPAAVAIPGFIFLFALLVRIALFALDRPVPILAVAGGVVREAMRLRIAVSFAAVALGLIPLLPLWIDAKTPLRYQVQTFLSTGLDLAYLACAFLTVFLGCATVAFEIRDRQAWLTLTKPVSRLSYLAGKWLGIVVLDAVILATASVAVYAFLLEVRTRQPKDVLDALAVQDEVLVARVGTIPEFKPLAPEELRAAVEEAIRADPNSQADIRSDPAREIEIKKDLARAIGGEHLKKQRSIAPGGEREYRFTGLGEAREAGANLTLRYKFFSGESDPNSSYPALFIFGDGDSEYADYRQFIAAQSNVVPVPASCIAPDGTLRLRVANVRVLPGQDGEPQLEPGRASIAFDLDGLELLYRVGGFGDNLFRAQLVNLLKLSFVAMLAVTCAAILSFPVACLVVFTVFAAGSVGPFLATSVAEYQIRSDATLVVAFEWAVRSVAGATEFAVRAFGDARANGPLVEGRLVSWGLVGRTLALIGVAWSGVLLVVGCLIFRRKELAIYSGQGG